MSKSKYLSDDQINAILNRAATNAINDISRVSYEAISKFYSDYTPEMYHRVYGLKNLFKVDTKRSPGRIIVTFTYSADMVQGWHRSREDAFETAFIYGKHGGDYAWGHLKKTVPVTYPSPWETIVKYVRYNYKVVI